MENNEFISASEKLTAFIDGELDAAESGTLFYEMASDTEMQEEMKDLLLIKNSFKNKLVTPPPALKNNILSGLGLAAAANNAGKVAAGILLLNFLRRHSVSIVLGLGLIFVAYFAFSPNGNNEIASEKEIPVSNSFETTPTDNQTSLSSSIEDKNNSTQNIKATESKNTVAASKNQSSSEILNENENVFVASNEPTDNFKITASNFTGKNIPINIQNRKFDLMNWLYSEKVANILGDFSIQFRVADGTSFPSPDLSSNSGLVNDFAVSVLYNLNQNSSVGVEFGRENFLMEFEGYEGDILFRYPQSYNALNWGAFYQYQFEQFSITQNLIPYSRLFIGGTNVGPIARFSLGANYLLTNNVSLNASGDYGVLVYSHLGNSFHTQKFSWSIGLSLGL